MATPAAEVGDSPKPAFDVVVEVTLLPPALNNVPCIMTIEVELGELELKLRTAIPTPVEGEPPKRPSALEVTELPDTATMDELVALTETDPALLNLEQNTTRPTLAAGLAMLPVAVDATAALEVAARSPCGMSMAVSTTLVVNVYTATPTAQAGAFELLVRAMT
jgi:hypothetical protein